MFVIDCALKYYLLHKNKNKLKKDLYKEKEQKSLKRKEIDSLKGNP
jgi:hypothetical protein